MLTNSLPIFLHSSFRTGSTYICSTFRQNRELITFYEPFNEQLETLDISNIYSINADNWNSRHPKSDPYFLEYAPLIDSGALKTGVQLYSATFSFDSFVPEGGLASNLSFEEIRYIQSLVSLANRAGKRPFFGCTRSLGRIRALMKEFGGLHILLHRNLIDQWLSYIQYKKDGNPYFISTVWRIIWLNQQKLFYFKHLIQTTSVDCHTSQAEFISLDESIQFKLFLASHLYLLATASLICACIIDLSRLYSDINYRKYTENLILATCGVNVDWQDIKRDTQVSNMDYDDSIVTDIENDVVDFLFREGYSAAVPFVLNQTREVRADLALLKSSARFWRSKIADSRPND